MTSYVPVERRAPRKHLATRWNRADVGPSPRVRASMTGQRAAVRKTLTATLKLTLVRPLTTVHA